MEQETPEESRDYNDGLGDMLREKGEQTFSWTKTSTVLLSLVIILVFGFILSVNLGKKLLKNRYADEVATESTGEAAYSDEDSHAELIEKIEQELALSERADQVPEPEVVEPEKPKPMPAKPKPEVKKPAAKPKVVEVKAKPVAKPKSALAYKVMAGSFVKSANANQYVKQLKAKGFDAFVWKVVIKGKTYYRVQVGAFETYAQGRTQVQLLNQKGFKDAYVLKK